MHIFIFCGYNNILGTWKKTLGFTTAQISFDILLKHETTLGQNMRTSWEINKIILLPRSCKDEQSLGIGRMSCGRMGFEGGLKQCWLPEKYLARTWKSPRQKKEILKQTFIFIVFLDSMFSASVDMIWWSKAFDWHHRKCWEGNQNDAVWNLSPKCSMYGLFTYKWLHSMENVGKHSIHGVFG